jgi:hypothetical protein
MIIETINCIVSKYRTRAPCNLGVKDCPAPTAAPFKIIDAAVWGVKGLCEVVAGVDYKGGTYVHAFPCFSKTVFQCHKGLLIPVLLISAIFF